MYSITIDGLCLALLRHFQLFKGFSSTPLRTFNYASNPIYSYYMAHTSSIRPINKRCFACLPGREMCAGLFTGHVLNRHSIHGICQFQRRGAFAPPNALTTVRFSPKLDLAVWLEHKVGVSGTSGVENVASSQPQGKL